MSSVHISPSLSALALLAHPVVLFSCNEVSYSCLVPYLVGEEPMNCTMLRLWVARLTSASQPMALATYWLSSSARGVLS